MWRKTIANPPIFFNFILKIFKSTHNSLPKPMEAEFLQMHQYCCPNSCFELDRTCKHINLEQSGVVGNLSLRQQQVVDGPWIRAKTETLEMTIPILDGPQASH